MKISILTICILLLLYPFDLSAQKNVSNSQRVKLKALYLNCGYGVENNISRGVGINFILSNNFGGSLSYDQFSLKEKNLPANYNQGIYPGSDNLTTRSLRLSKVFPSHEKILRFSLEAGFSLVEYEETQFQDSNYSSRNYTTSTTIKQSIGLSLLAKAEFPILSNLGLEFSIISNVNPLRSFIGLKIHLLIGVLRKKA